MNKMDLRSLLLLFSLAAVTGRDVFTDAATRLAYDFERRNGRAVVTGVR
jgi:hypothetical protein